MMEKKLMEWANMFCQVLSICMATLEVSPKGRIGIMSSIFG